MSARPRLADVAPGQELHRATYRLDRTALVRYAGASGDLNRIHWDDAFARSVGLPGVIAHGMLTMGVAARAVTDWCGDPGAVVEYGTRFTRPVEVPADGTAEVEVVATARSVDPDAGTATVDLAVTCGGAAVLGRARAVVRLP